MKKKGSGHGHFCSLSNLIFSLQFSLHFGENFLVDSEKKDLGPPFIFLTLHPTKHTQKSFSSHSLSKVFYPLYFTSKQTHSKNKVSIFNSILGRNLKCLVYLQISWRELHTHKTNLQFHSTCCAQNIFLSAFYYSASPSMQSLMQAKSLVLVVLIKKER